jgi:hypothetical protein
VLAGALLGLLLLAAEGLTRAGGSSVVAVVTGFSTDALTELTDRGKLRHALIVRTAGGVVALIAALRTLGRDRDSADESADASESADSDD